MAKYWLMKAEPDPRIVKGKDVKFSVDDFESTKTTPWEGVRNHEAKNLMKEMKIGEKILFYHSNCKLPGVAGFAEVSKEAYPDYTAWDSKHPYFDPKSDKENPKWFMIEAKFNSRAKHFVPLALLRFTADITSSEPPGEIAYIGESGLEAIKGMALVNRGRLSVQRVEEDAWDAIQKLTEGGGWDNMDFGKKPKKAKKAPSTKTKKVVTKRSRAKKDESEDDDRSNSEGDTGVDESIKPLGSGKKRKVDQVEDSAPSSRRSTRNRTQ